MTQYTVGHSQRLHKLRITTGGDPNVHFWLGQGYICLTPEGAEKLAETLQKLANEARENKTKNETYQADNQTR